MWGMHGTPASNLSTKCSNGKKKSTNETYSGFTCYKYCKTSKTLKIARKVHPGNTGTGPLKMDSALPLCHRSESQHIENRMFFFLLFLLIVCVERGGKARIGYLMLESVGDQN